jgi:hypothetical protein
MPVRPDRLSLSLYVSSIHTKGKDTCTAVMRTYHFCLYYRRSLQLQVQLEVRCAVVCRRPTPTPQASAESGAALGVSSLQSHLVPRALVVSRISYSMSKPCFIHGPVFHPH